MAVDTLARAIAAGKVPVTAYEYAVQKGYTGTEEEFATDMGNSATNATNAATSASEAAASAASAVAAATNFAPAYSSSATYAVGDHVLYDGGYYVCNTAITTAEAWTAAHWTATKVGPEITELKTQLSIYAGNSQIDFTSGGYITTNQGVGQTVTLTPETAVLMSYAIVDCVEGDNFTINGVGTSAGRAWAFIDSSNKILTVADASVTLENVTVVAPENANKCILNLVIASRGVCLKGKLQTTKNTETDSEIAAIKTDIDNIKQFDSDLFDEFSNNLLLKGTIEERTYYRGSTGVKDYPNNALFSVVNIPLKDVVKDLYLGQSMFTYSDSVPAAAEGNTARSIAFYDKNGDYVGGGEPYSQPAAVKYGVNIPATAVTMNVSFYYANGTSYPNAVKPTVYWAYTEKVLEEYEYFSPENKVKTISIIDIDKNNHADFVSARRPTICFTLDGNYPRTQAIIDIAEAHGYRIGIAPKWNQSFNEAVAENARYYPISKFLEWQDKGHEILSHMGLDLSPSTTLTDEQAISCIRTSYLSAIERGFKVKGAIGSAGNVADKFIPYVQRWYSYGSTLNNHSEYAGGTPELAFLSTEPYRMWRYSMQQSTLDGMKDAVDDAITNNGLLIFYGHALDNSQVIAEGHVMEDPDTYGDNPDTPGSTTNLAGTDHFTEDNFDALLTYIDGKVSEGACQVNIPYYAVNEYYKLRKSDFTWT